MLKRLAIFATVALLFWGSVTAQEVVRDSVEVRFRQGKSVVDWQNEHNKRAVEELGRWKENFDSKEYKYFLQSVDIYGAASPEGGVKINNRLSVKRADALMDKVSEFISVPDSIISPPLHIGRDWRKLRVLASSDSKLPHKQAVLDLLDTVIKEVENGVPHRNTPLTRLQSIGGGRAYNYLYSTYFSSLRASKLYLTYIRVSRALTTLATTDLSSQWGISPLLNSDLCKMIVPKMVIEQRPFYMSLKTNLLTDAAIIPNLGAEFYLGSGYSVAGSWSYSWWKNDNKYWYWRTYGGDIAVRKYFGKAAKLKPLTGSHVGVYAQAFTYDFSNKKGGELCDTWSYGVGAEYGYSLPIARRLNLDFVIGVGYLGGLYKEYIPQDDCYVWQATKRRHFFGPTKAEISLVWLIGRGNFNKGKGKQR